MFADPWQLCTAQTLQTGDKLAMSFHDMMKPQCLSQQDETTVSVTQTQPCRASVHPCSYPRALHHVLVHLFLQAYVRYLSYPSKSARGWACLASPHGGADTLPGCADQDAHFDVGARLLVGWKQPAVSRGWMSAWDVSSPAAHQRHEPQDFNGSAVIEALCMPAQQLTNSRHVARCRALSRIHGCPVYGTGATSAQESGERTVRNGWPPCTQGAAQLLGPHPAHARS